MKLNCPSFRDGETIPADYALCVPAVYEHLTLGPNKNPTLTWSGLPPGTRSLVLICLDRDAPGRSDAVNAPDHTLPADLPRTDFYHWILVDLPPAPAVIDAAEFSEGGLSRHDKRGPAGPRGTRQGLNSYTDWFRNDPDMAGKYFGYDGPCPPWNDTIVHRYVFTLYALDVERCPVEGEFTAPDVLRAIEGHVLDTVSLTGLYGMNPAIEP